MERRAAAAQRALCRFAASTAAPAAARVSLMRPTERFSSRADDYARSRPGYPPAAIDLLASSCGLSASAVVADIGSGTGLLTEPLLERAAQVFAVEPNGQMRAVAEARLGGQTRFHSVNGTAEATTLAPMSIDLIVVGQALHWFDVPRARREALRIIRSGGCGALLWNERPSDPGPFLADYEALLLRRAAEYAQIKARRAEEVSMREFLGGAMQRASFPNQQTLDFAGLKGRLLSSSYAPEPGHPQYEPLLADLHEVFRRHERGGQVVFPYQTLVYFAPLTT
jgi:SAM-dependent methyltransferase